MSQNTAAETIAADRPVSFKGVSDTLRALARVIGCPPDERQIRAFADTVHTFGTDAPGCTRMMVYFHGQESRPIAELTQELGVDWTLAFRGVNPAEGPRPPYAGAWLAEDGVGVEIMMQVNARYVERGLGHGAGRLNRLDYLGAEIEFVAYLLDEYCRAETDEQRRGVAADIVSFEDEFVLSWLPRYRAAVEDTCKTDFWKGYLELLEAFLADLRSQCAEKAASH